MAADNRSIEHEGGTLVLLKDFYNVREVAALLHWSRGRVYAMASVSEKSVPKRVANPCARTRQPKRGAYG